MAAEILINVRPQETRVAYVDSGILTDLKIERKTSPTLVGSVFKGKVSRVLPGMQAAFVDIGLEKAAFLYVGDIVTSKEINPEEIEEEHIKSSSEAEESAETSSDSIKYPPIQDLLKEGQMLLVQVAKDPIGTKGARITTQISLAGRFVVYMPEVKHIGVSRRIEGESERDRLRSLIGKINPSGGVIVRTAGEGASEESLRADVEYLDRLSKEVLKLGEKKKTTGMVHSEMDVELQALRDMLSSDVVNVYVDDEEVYKKVTKFIVQLIPKFKQNVMYYTDQKPLFDLYEIDLEISRSMDRKIWLKSGGYIIIDEAEALVVIDVNTGRYVGKKDLEDTILKTNLEAVKEIAHQLRIRNCGGIIIIDFIDMEKGTHRDKVMNYLAEELQKDRARTHVVSMSTLGLVEMTRKRTRPSLIKTLCDPCSYCDGKGHIKKKSTVASEIFRELERDLISRKNQKESVVVHCHIEVVDWIYEVESHALDHLEKKLARTIAFKVEPKYHVEQYEVFIN
jgi:ribonuclease G